MVLRVNILEQISRLFLRILFIILAVACVGEGSIDDDDDDDEVDFEEPVFSSPPDSTQTINGNPDQPLQGSNFLINFIKKEITESFMSIIDKDKALEMSIKNKDILELIPLLQSKDFLNIDFIMKISECMVDANISILGIMENLDKYTESSANVEKIKNFIDLFFKKNVLNISITKQNVLDILNGDNEETKLVNLFNALFIYPLQLLQKSTDIIKNYTSDILDPKKADAIKTIIRKGNKNVLYDLKRESLNKNIIDSYENIKYIVPQVNFNEESKTPNLLDNDEKVLYEKIIYGSCGIIAPLLSPHIKDSNNNSFQKRALSEDEVVDVMYKYFITFNPKIKDLESKINYLFKLSKQSKSYNLIETIISYVFNNLVSPYVGLLPKALIEFLKHNLKYENMEIKAFKNETESKDFLAKLKEGQIIIPLIAHKTALHYFNGIKRSDKFDIVNSNFYTQEKNSIDNTGMMNLMGLSQNKILPLSEYFLAKTILNKGGNYKTLIETDKKKLENLLKAFCGNKFKDLNEALNKTANIIKSNIADDLDRKYDLNSSNQNDIFDFNYVLIKISDNERQ